MGKGCVERLRKHTHRERKQKWGLECVQAAGRLVWLCVTVDGGRTHPHKHQATHRQVNDKGVQTLRHNAAGSCGANYNCSQNGLYGNDSAQIQNRPRLLSIFSFSSARKTRLELRAVSERRSEMSASRPGQRQRLDVSRSHIYYNLISVRHLRFLL